MKSVIEAFDISSRTIISSFRHEIANGMKMEPKSDFKVLQLFNDWDEPEQNGYETPPGLNGVNLDLKYLD